MYTQSLLAVIAMLGNLAASAPLTTRQSSPCFIIGDAELPVSVANIVTSLTPIITCSRNTRTLSGVPDVTSGSVTFSDIDFTRSSQSPLQFALAEFAANEDNLADTDLQRFEDSLNVYLATEAGIRSVSGGLAIKVPKFFLEMQVSRIRTAQGNPPTEPGLQVNHLRDKVTKNAARESQELLDQVIALAAKLQ